MEDINELGTKGRLLSCWAGMFAAKPELYFEPHNTEQIRKIIAVARIQKKTIRVVGSMHSFNDMLFGSEFILNLKNISSVTKVDNETKQVTVGAGMDLSQLCAVLANHGLALPMLPFESSVTIGGAISTGTHGTGNIRNLSSFVTGIELLTSAGEIRWITDDDGDLMLAVRVSMGMFGVILSVTLQCLDQYNLESTTSYSSRNCDEIMNEIDQHLKEEKSIQLFWYPRRDGCVTHEINVSSKPPNKRPTPSFLDFIKEKMVAVILWFGTYFSSIKALGENLYIRKVAGNYCNYVDVPHKVLFIPIDTKSYAAEWAIPRTHATEAFQEIRQWLNNINLPIELMTIVRFCKADDSFLSNCFECDVCYINVILPFDERIYPKYNHFAELERIATKYNGRPHWGKMFIMSKEQLKKLYPKWDLFCDIRQQMDPDGIFLTKSLKSLFC